MIPASLLPWIAGFSVFLAAALMVAGIGNALAARMELKRRLLSADGVAEDPRMPGREKQAKVAAFLDSLGRRFKPGEEDKQGTIRRELMLAGITSPAAVGIYNAARLLCSLGLPLIVLAFLPMVLPIASALVLAAALGVLGWFFPAVYVSRRTAAVADDHRLGFPDMMDLMVIATGAGVGIETAIQRIARELGLSRKHLGGNLHLLSLELRAGRALSDALSSFAERAGIEEASAFALLIRQSEELGTSINEALKVYSEEMRAKRMSRAEERANSLPVRLVLPLGLCIFPVMLVICLLPALLRIRDAML